jgi:DNA-binding transcriptional ArsR family regulator
MALKHIFGETPAIKILDFLIDQIGYDYSKTEIAGHAGIGWTTINRHWRTLEEWDLVIPTRKIGRATLYKLNEENPIVSQLLEFDEVASTYMSERIAEQELRATAAIHEPVPAAAHSVA